MPAQQNMTLVRRLYDEVYSKGHITVLDQLVSHDVKLVDAAQPHFKSGLPTYKQIETNYERAFPGKSVKIDEILCADDKVVVRWTTSGTHKGPLQDIDPTGRHIKISGISIYRISNGKIVEINQSWDRLGLLEQLGVIEPAEALH